VLHGDPSPEYEAAALTWRGQQAARLQYLLKNGHLTGAAAVAARHLLTRDNDPGNPDPNDYEDS
jgi:hypothetical protein